MKRVFGTIASLAIAASVLAQDSKPAAPAAAAAENPLHPRVKLETSFGDIVVELDGEKAPISTDNFVEYVEEKFYDGLTFHRVMPTFMIQGGGFNAELTKKQASRPPIKNEWQNGLKNARGTIAMARTPAPDSATSEFFINVVDNASLDEPRGGAAYAVFGKVVEGMEVVDKIKDTPTKTDQRLPMGKVVPETPVVIKSAKLVSKYDKEKVKAEVKKWEEAAAAAAKQTEEATRKEFDQTVAKIEKETGKKMEKSASGLMWTVLKEGSGASPQPTDTVEVHYTGWLLNGTKFDSSVDRGVPTTMPLKQFIKGWIEGVGMMKVGEKRKLLIPYELAYGKQGRPPVIPAAAPLLFEVELLSIK